MSRLISDLPSRTKHSTCYQILLEWRTAHVTEPPFSFDWTRASIFIPHLKWILCPLKYSSGSMSSDWGLKSSWLKKERKCCPLHILISLQEHLRFFFYGPFVVRHNNCTKRDGLSDVRLTGRPSSEEPVVFFFFTWKCDKRWRSRRLHLASISVGRKDVHVCKLDSITWQAQPSRDLPGECVVLKLSQIPQGLWLNTMNAR